MILPPLSPGSDHIPAELIQAGGDILHSTIHKLKIGRAHVWTPVTS
jgi:hypothetical protein